MKSFFFGEVILFEEKEYIFLHLEPDIVFLAQLIDTDTVRQLKSGYEALANDGSRSAQHKRRSNAYCYIELTTERYRGYGAHLAKTEYGFDDYASYIDVLCLEDKQKLKEEILREDSPCSKRLKDVVSKFQIQ